MRRVELPAVIVGLISVKRLVNIYNPLPPPKKKKIKNKKTNKQTTTTTATTKPKN